MQKLSKIFIFLFVLFTISIWYLAFSIPPTAAQDPVPDLKFPCGETSDNEFHSLRPYQAAPCSDGPKALFCSNKLVIFETFNLSQYCQQYKSKTTRTFDCALDYYVQPHDLNITLDKSELPIMGNTEDGFDDAQNLNEYASWYLSGVDSTGSTGEATDDQIVNFSGPINKLLPQMIQDSERKRTIYRATDKREYTAEDDEGKTTQVTSVEMHDQIAVCGSVFKLLGIEIGQIRPSDCYSGNEKIRLSEWLDDLSDFNGIANRLGRDVWNKRYPPLPWDDGIVENPSEDNPPKPFESQTAYQKAYKEWRGESCITIPFVDKNFCVENPFVPNKWASLYPYIPLSSTTDVEGKNYLLTGDGPNYVPSSGTEIDGAQHESYKNAILYLPHMQEVYDLSQLLNKTFRPTGYEPESLPKTTEKLPKGISTKTNNTLNQASPNPKPNNQIASRDPYANLDCSAVNVRVNEGDNIFPGDRPNDEELFVKGAEYRITQVQCQETYTPPERACGPLGLSLCRESDVIKCTGQVGIEFKTGTKTPYANEIFADTVADSGSTFRKIFPKVEAGAPVECIADIPTVTNVTYELDKDLNEAPNGGTQELKKTVYPADGGNGDTQLTFNHIGSVYEYFLKGIQTALRPKGYGEPIANGNCKPTEPVACGEWEEKLEKSSGGDCGICSSELGDLAKRILATAGKAYNVPAANIWAAMKHEGGDWDEFRGQFTDENVRKWSNTEDCGGEPMPGCDNSVASTQPPFGFLINWFYTSTGNADDIWNSVQKIDPTRDSQDKVSRCNFLDAAYGAANLLSQVSTAPANGIMGCSKWTSFDNSRPRTCSSLYWTDAHIVQSQTTYAGSCVNDDPNHLYTVEDTVSWFNSAKCN